MLATGGCWRSGRPTQLTLLADETERVTCRIRVDPPAAVALAVVKQGGAKFEDLFLCLIEIPDRQIEVELLRATRFWPLRRLMVFRSLESKHKPGVSVQGRPAIIE